MSWYTEGADKVDQVAKDQEEARNGMRRVWIPQNTTIPVVFLDERFFTYPEHNWQANGHWRNWTTCIGKPNGCPMCLSGSYSKMVTAFTVLDMSKWQDKKGMWHYGEKKLLTMKIDQAKLLKDKMARWGGLKGKQVLISRKGQDDFATGSDFELAMANGQLIIPNLSEFKDLKPFDYAEVLKPKAAGELQNLVGQAQTSAANGEEVPLTSGGNHTPPETMDTVPF